MPPTLLIHHLTKSQSYRLKKDPIFFFYPLHPTRKIRKTTNGTKRNPIQTQKTRPNSSNATSNDIVSESFKSPNKQGKKDKKKKEKIKNKSRGTQRQREKEKETKERE